jgi:hypothetical protein
MGPGLKRRPINTPSNTTTRHMQVSFAPLFTTSYMDAPTALRLYSTIFSITRRKKGPRGQQGPFIT